MTGHLFGDRYQVGDTLGFGGMSEVHRGRDLRLGRDVAIKVLRADLARDPSFQTRFRREAQNAASLNHPAIVAVYDTGETAGETGPIPYIVMEYVDGETLRDLLKREGPLAPKRAMEIMADVCAALDFSHRHGIVHRDIKPANVMLTRAGAVKVMDFGIARAVADGQATVTATAAVIGTAQYLSPEQARGESVDARSDVYATGCVLFELLTGAPPFTGDSPVAVAYQHVREDPKAPSEVKPGLPRELDAIVLKALNKNPLNRYQTAAEMRSDLVRALSGQAVHATPVMSDQERTEMIRPGPMRIEGQRAGGSGKPPLLAPPRAPDDLWAEEEPESRSKKRVWGFIGVGVLCAALLAGAIFFTLRIIDSGNTPSKVAVPQVAGMTQDQAIANLRSNNLQVGNIVEVDSSDDDKGKVISQNPSQDTVVDAGTSVTLNVGKGVTKVRVPDVSGMTKDAATKAVEGVGLTIVIKDVESNDDQRDKAITQDPAAQQDVDPSSSVTVSFGTGLKRTAVPENLVGKSFDEAAKLLEAAHLVATKVETDSPQPLNQVLSLQGSAPNDNVPWGSTVLLQVSNNSQFLMPNLLNQTPEQAAATLKDLGWGGSVDTFIKSGVDVTDTALINSIVTGPGGCAAGQAPAPETPQSKASASITICVGQPKMLTVEPVSGLTVYEAVGQLQSLGFTNVSATSLVGVVPPAGQGNRVQGTDPEAGNVVRFDTPIVVRVYVAEPPPPTSSSQSAPPSAGGGGTTGGAVTQGPGGGG
ncbi:Stk1 family PASTA domain-containing Ser/Thr kinase [Nakamurella sp. YIM 132087]|uniref:non-specific serine/threonine protein kinase n=1 Tax=Nakamurella alba TaxID=2665158 RepID=A0A7K1FKS3_9ACTN|nr:Stk1 family PASTA domain-containing Ser/Thr kinase [Nakamurella alba]MTD14741.1 Stk1 family PASTA domain-containing Ser/Thr kinase [Nakamurella alba]